MIPFPEETQTLGPIPGSDSSRKQSRVSRAQNQGGERPKGSWRKREPFSSRPSLALEGTLFHGQLGTPHILSL